MRHIKNKIFVTMILAAGLASGCKKKLDLQPYNQIVNTTAFSTAARCALAINGVYDAAQSGVYDPLNGTATSDRGYPFGAAAIEQSEMRGEDCVNIQTFYLTTYLAQYNTLTPNNVNMWKELYALINKANLSIVGFRGAGTNNVISSSLALQYEAECRFLRAMAHHELLLNFCKPYADNNGAALGVPYRDFAIDGQASVAQAQTQPRDLVKNNYVKILADLDFAETNLPANGGVGVNTIRATKAAAVALKARVKMHMGDWAGVQTEVNKLLPTALPVYPTMPTTPVAFGTWTLTASPDGPFVDNLSAESIFSIRNDPNDNPQTNAALSRMFGSVTLGGRGLVSLSPILFNLPEWTCSDKRKTLLTADGASAITTATKFSKKYKDYGTYSDYAPYIRYAEVLLMGAEAEARLDAGISARGLTLLNYVRNRALNNPATEAYTAASFADKTAFIKAILAERRIEFAAEGKRWGDIHRLATDAVFGTGGIPAKMASGFVGTSAFACAGVVPPRGADAIPYSDYRFLWPIPAQERNTNPIVEQNPGY